MFDQECLIGNACGQVATCPYGYAIKYILCQNFFERTADLSVNLYPKPPESVLKPETFLSRFTP